MREERMVTCDICCGTGMTPVECTGADFNTGVRFYTPKPDAKPCGTCEGKGELMRVVSDEPEHRDEYLDFREEQQARQEFERDTDMYR